MADRRARALCQLDPAIEPRLVHKRDAHYSRLHVLYRPDEECRDVLRDPDVVF
ncbi:MAG: hypothetical protein RL701_596 [Pseudomonadota bacterium]|jgi:hypothetical protein